MFKCDSIGNTAKKTWKSKEVDKELENSFTDVEKYEGKDLNKKADAVKKCEDKVAVIRENRKMIWTKDRTLVLMLMNRVIFSNV